MSLLRRTVRLKARKRLIELWENSETECWLWHGAISNSGSRPVIRDRDKPALFVQRAIFEEMRGYLPKYLQRKCGVARCCNPDHAVESDHPARGKRWATPPRTHWFETNDRGCWLWTGVATTNGYGSVMIEGERAATHVRSYELTYGSIAGRVSVRHACDVHLCCRPDHLSLGTQRENSEDMAQRYRAGSTKLSPNDLEAIRKLRTDGVPYRKIATQFAVTHRTVQKIVRGWGYGGRRVSRVALTIPKPDTPCWEWEGQLGIGGYGRTKLGGHKVPQMVHRIAWQQVHGPIAKGLIVRHACDRRSCIRVDHLYLGTHQDNSDDTNARLRGRHKMTWDQVEQIRAMRKTGISYARIGAAFDLDQTAVMRICRNETYVRSTDVQSGHAASTVLLVQLDGSLPNIALMRLSAHWKKAGCDVQLRRWTKVSQCRPELGDRPHAVYGSAIFERTLPVANALRQQFPGAIGGGTGVDRKLSLEMLGALGREQDYSLYPGFTPSMGFTQRGCRLKCSFCVVPEKEGAVKEEQSIGELWRGDPWPRHLILLDNDFFGQPNWRTRIAEIRDGGFRVSFNQGINARLLNDEAAEAIASVEYYNHHFDRRQIYTAWDNRKDEERLFTGLRALVRYGVNPRSIMVYILIGYWPGETHEDREYRRKTLRDFGCVPYPMPYVRTRELVGFQRWVIGAYDKRVNWADWEASGYNPRAL